MTTLEARSLALAVEETGTRRRTLITVAHLSWRQLCTPKFILAAICSALLICWVALREGQINSPQVATHHLLQGALFGVCVPLLALLATERALSEGSLGRTVGHFARQGASRKTIIWSLAGSLTCALMVVEAPLAALGMALSAGTSASIWRNQLPHTVVTLCAANLAYASLFLVSSTLGKRGGGRRILFLLDWLIGVTGTSVALILPRVYVRSLTTANVLPELAPGVTLGILAAFASCCLGLLVFKTPD